MQEIIQIAKQSNTVDLKSMSPKLSVLSCSDNHKQSLYICLSTALLPFAAVQASIPYLLIGHTTTHKFEQGIFYTASQRVAYERVTGGGVGLPGGPCPVAEGRG